MDVKGFIDEVTPDMLKYPYNQWAKCIGVKNLYGLLELIGGKTRYIPSTYTCFRPIIEQIVVDEYSQSGVSQQELADKCGFDKKTVQKWIRESKKRGTV